MATELMRGLDPFYVEAETHRMEAITMQASGALVQQGESSMEGTLIEADGFQDMGSYSVVIADSSCMSLTEFRQRRDGERCMM